MNVNRLAIGILALLLTYASGVMAVPNIWNMGALQGYVEYGISNEHNDVVSIACNEGAGEDYDNGVTITLANGKDYTAEQNHIEFVINDESYTIPPDSMIRSHAALWNNFILAIGKATKFDVYIDNKRVAEFNPLAGNVQKIFKDLTCKSMW